MCQKPSCEDAGRCTGAADCRRGVRANAEILVELPPAPDVQTLPPAPQVLPPAPLPPPQVLPPAPLPVLEPPAPLPTLPPAPLQGAVSKASGSSEPWQGFKGCGKKGANYGLMVPPPRAIDPQDLDDTFDALASASTGKRTYEIPLARGPTEACRSWGHRQGPCLQHTFGLRAHSDASSSLQLVPGRLGKQAPASSTPVLWANNGASPSLQHVWLLWKRPHKPQPPARLASGQTTAQAPASSMSGLWAHDRTRPTLQHVWPLGNKPQPPACLASGQQANKPQPPACQADKPQPPACLASGQSTAQATASSMQTGPPSKFRTPVSNTCRLWATLTGDFKSRKRSSSGCRSTSSCHQLKATSK
jgi:hypothetical protein